MLESILKLRENCDFREHAHSYPVGGDGGDSHMKRLVVVSLHDSCLNWAVCYETRLLLAVKVYFKVQLKK